MMKLDALLEEFNISIEQLKRKEKSLIPLSRSIIKLAKNTLSKMQLVVQKNGFDSQTSEIDFFKKIKPVPLASLIYSKELIDFENSFPKVCLIQQEKYFGQNLSRLQHFFSSHIDFGQYLELNSTQLDQHYFTRNPNGNFYESNSIINLEHPEIRSPKDTLLAQFNAYGKLAIHIRKKKMSSNGLLSESTKTSNLKWTGSKVDLIELIYAVHSSGSLQKGTGIKEIAKAYEKLFEIDLGNYYRKFIELRNRKLVERTQYIDRLKSSLIDRMDKVDD